MLHKNISGIKLIADTSEENALLPNGTPKGFDMRTANAQMPIVGDLERHNEVDSQSGCIYFGPFGSNRSSNRGYP